MEPEAQLMREIFSLPGVNDAQVVSKYRDEEGKTSEVSQDYGKWCMDDGDYEGAIRQYRRALGQCRADKHELLVDLGAAYESAGMTPQAYKQYKHAASIRESSELSQALSSLFQQYGHNTESLVQLEGAIKQDPENAYNHFKLAEGLRKMGQKKLALEAIAHAVSYSADDPFYHYWMGDVLLEMSRYEESLQSLAAAVELTPKDDHLYQLVGLALWGSGKKKEAIRSIRLASDMNSENRVNYALLATFLKITGMDKEAEQESEKVAEMDRFETDICERLLALVGISSR